MLNRFEFIGHIGNRPEVKTLDSGVKVATFSVAVTKRGYTLTNGTTVPEKTTWIRVIAWRGLGEIVEKYTDKGSHVYIAGELQTRSYEKDGITRDVVEIIAENIELLGKKPEAGYNPEESTYTGQPQPDRSAQKPEFANSDGGDQKDDLPFSPGSR